jgi:hypothetical protein
MKLSRDYLFGLGSGLILSSLIIISSQWLGILPESKDLSERSAQGEYLSESTAQEEYLSKQQPTAANEAPVSSGLPDEEGLSDGSEPLNPSHPDSGSPVQEEINAGVAAAERTLTIPPGATATVIIDLLYSQGIIADKRSFRDTVEKRNATKRFRAGTFIIPSGIDYDELVTILTKIN